MPPGPADIQTLVKAFTDRFGRSPRFAAAAPGRVNLIGEHTDYNDGFVLPMAIGRRAIIVADRAVEAPSTLWAVDLDEVVAADLAAPLSPIPGSFANYLLGVAGLLAARGQAVPNLDLALAGSIPIGAGLASSAAVEVATATLLEQVLGIRLDPVEKALLCQRAEQTFAGTPCGIMDMFTATHARPGHALLVDCRNKTARPCPMPPAEQVAVLIADTGVRRGLAASGYADRRLACADAAAALGLESLRDADLDRLQDGPISDEQRHLARHVILENQRVLLAAAALKTNDLHVLGELMFDSHASLRELFRVSCDELDSLVDTAIGLRGEAGVIGARLTGGGFGGSCVVLCRTGAVESVCEQLRRHFAARFGHPPATFTATPAGAARAITL
ncbi:MAG: galactokinase [Planctomycetota bacterium]|jgi:galactokinase